MGITKGSKVTAAYVGKLEDGTIFDQSVEGKPLAFTFGEGKLIPGFEAGIGGLEAGQRTTITVACGQGYGDRDETLIRKIDAASIPADMAVEKGMILRLHLPNGGAIPATVREKTDGGLIVDLNHPLAGKTLIFDVTILSVE
jgi:FKBP-type peptidyl-prolyl cis-trans isomerase 2